MSTFLIGVIMTGGPFVSIFANPFWGYLSDRLQNIKRIIIIMMWGNLIVIQFVFHLNIQTIVFIAMIIFFFFQTPMFSQSNSLILNTIEGTDKKFGSFRIWGSIGWSLMAIIAGPILDKLGILNLWVVYSFFLVLALICTVKLPQGKVEGVEKPERGGYFQALLGNKYFLVFVVLGVLISVPNSINQTFVSLYISELGGASSYIGLAAFFMAVFEIPVFLLLDKFLKRKVPTMIGMLIIVSLLFVLRWFLMSIAISPLQIVLIQILHSVTFGGYYYIGTTLTAQLIPVKLRASGQAVFALTWGGISGIIAGFSGGWMFENLGPSLMYVITTVVTVVGVLGFVVMYLRIRRDERYVN